MSWIKAALLAGFLSHLLIAAAPEALAKDRNCRRGDRVQIQDLDMSPDPVIDGQRIRAWKARVRFDGRRDCNTDIYIREGNNVVGHARDYKLRSGINDIEIPARDNFRFRGREICFNVQVDLDGSRQQIDADRRFCATQRTMWSMREPDDRRAQR
jgi:hypothetical protein